MLPLTGSTSDAEAIAGEGIVGAGSAAEGTRQQTEDGLLTPKQSALAATSGAATSLFGALGRKAAKALGIADIDALAAGEASSSVNKAFTHLVIEGAVSEGLPEELPQSVSEQVLHSYALGKPLYDGVDQAAVFGALAGGLLGGAANVRGAPTQGQPLPQAAPAPTAGPAITPAGPAPTEGPAVPPTGPTAAPSQGATLPFATPAAAPPFDPRTASQLPPLPAVIAPEPAPRSPANSPQGSGPAVRPDQGALVPLDPAAAVDIENFGNEPLPADLVRQQFLADQGLIERPDGSIGTEAGAVLAPAVADEVRAFLADADDAAATLEEQGAAVTPESVRAELKNRQRVRDLQAERGNACTPEAQAVLDEQIAAASAPAGGRVSELQAVADQATERGDKQTAKAAQDAIKKLQEPADGAVADRGSEGGSAVVERGLDAAAGAGSGVADTGGVEIAAAGTAPAGGAPVAVDSGAVQSAAGVGDQPAPVPVENPEGSKPAKPSTRLKSFEGDRLANERVRNDFQGMADRASLLFHRSPDCGGMWRRCCGSRFRLEPLLRKGCGVVAATKRVR